MPHACPPRLLPALALTLVGAGLLAATSARAATDTPTPSTKDILAASRPAEWRALAQDGLLYMRLSNGHRVIIELAPDWAPAHVANIKTLVRQRYFDGTSVYRVQDNFVAQWGDPNSDDPKQAKSMGAAKTRLPPEFTRPWSRDIPVTPLPDGDVYAPHVGLSRGLPMAWDTATGKAWLVQCYGMVGVARNVDPHSGNGNTLYVPIGQAPRRIDHQLAVVGRVVKGMRWLAALPRGPEPMGMYTKADQRTPIQSIRLGSTVPAARQISLEALRTDSATFKRLVQAKRNEHNAFYTVPPGAIGICAVPLPIRRAK